MSDQIELFKRKNGESPSRKTHKLVNVASVPQRSPFRYAGGKTWFVPTFRAWMKKFDPSKVTMIEPFVGGGIISLTTAFEGLAKKVIMVELDAEVAAVWETIVNEGEGEWLANEIMNFELSVESAKRIIGQDKEKLSIKERAFVTVLKNRVNHGGILTTGTGMLKHGENGKGILSRWYPQTLKKRIENISLVRHKIDFIEGDAFEIIDRYKDKKEVAFFVDPPYTKAGKRLYNHFDLDDELLIKKLSKVKGSFLITYDNTDEVAGWAEKYGLDYRLVPMKTTHHITKYEIVISDNFDWLDEAQTK